MQAHTQEMPILSVTELSNALKRTVESSFSLVRIRGEISSLKVHSSGHMYFSLKDNSSVIDGICWRGTVSRLSMRPEDGMDVVCYGRVTTYPARSKYQVIVDRMELAGVGALMKLLQERKERLLKEGVFDPAHKKPLPFLPKTIGVVTSPTGAVIRDILHRIKDRFPCRVIVWPVSVQGETASQEVTQAIQGFNQLETKPDLLIVARGGGSLEDLWAFNEENVVRAVFASHIPVISAVGHETDTTLIDYVSDQRAPTPTAAAEIAVPVRQDLLITCNRYAQQLKAALVRLFREKRYILEASSRSLLMRHPKRILEERWQTLDERGERLASILKVILERKSQKLNHLASLLESYSYHKTLERGFVLVKQADGSPIQSSKNLLGGESINLAFHDGERRARVEE